MPRQIVLESPGVNRRQPLLTEKHSPKDDKHRIGEMAGGTAAECAAICCCFPCALMNLVVMAVYKVPTGLCKKAWKKKKRQRMKKTLLQQQQQKKNGPTSGYGVESGDDDEPVVDAVAGSTEAVDMEKEMWDRFYGAGFWRSPSQRDD